MKWHERLEQEMLALGWNKAELSRRAGIPYDSVNKYLRGDIDQPRGDTLEKLARAIGREVIWLRDGMSASDTDAGTTQEQIAGLATASADMTCELVNQLRAMQKINGQEAAVILSDLAAHNRDLARRNPQAPGQAAVYERIARRIDAQLSELKTEVDVEVNQTSRELT